MDEKIKQWATVRQAEFVDAVNEHGSLAKAAKAIGVNHRTVERSIASLKKKAAMQGHAPEHDLDKTVPSPLVLKGVSTLYGAEGEVKLQWVKSQLDLSLAREAIEEWVGWLMEDAKGLAKPTKAPAHSEADLLAIYPMGDPHFGMYAWWKETGNSFDLDIAERDLTAAIDRLVASAPDAETALILELGDFFHADNSTARTPKSGNMLDVDTRWAKVMQVGLRAMIYCVKATLRKHKTVIVRIVAGNHDPHSSFALALALDAYFHNEPRVTIDLSPAAFWYYRFGNVLIGTTHGDTIKPIQLPGIMAHDRAAEWGVTKYRYWYTGHIHNETVREYPGVTHETFRTLAPLDAWAASAGYRAGRDMRCIVHHKDFGEIERHRCDIAMINGGKK